MIWINFLKKEPTKKRTFTENTWYDWYYRLINYIPEPIQKTVDGVKDQIMSVFKTKYYDKQEPVKIVYGGEKKLNKPKTKNTRNPFLIKKKRKRKKKLKDTFQNRRRKKRRKEIREKRTT